MAALVAWVVLPAAAQTWGLSVRDAPGSPGVEITAVVNATPAERAGLREGDAILRLDGAPVKSAREFAQKLAALPAGSVIALAASRQGWERELRIELVGSDVGFGITVIDTPSARGPLVVRIEPESVAAIVGIEPGDVVTEIGGRRVAAVRDLQSLRVADGRRQLLTLARGQRTTEIVLVAGAPPDRAPPPAARPAPAAPEGVAGPMAGSVVDEIVEANRAYEAGRWADADTRYSRVLAVMRDVPQAWGRLCHARVMQGRCVEALATCGDAARMLPNDATVFQNAGFCLARLGRHAEAVVEFQKALAIAPERVDTYRSVAGSYFALRNWPRAEEYFREVVKRDPANQAAWQSLGDAQGELGRTADAIASYRRSLELGPVPAAVHRALGWQLYRAERYAEAEPVLAEARRLNPRDANTLVTLGSVKYKLGKTADAREAWQRALDLEPNSPIGAIARQSLASVGGEIRPADGAARPEPPESSAPKAPAPPRGSDVPPDAPEPEIDVGG